MSSHHDKKKRKSRRRGEKRELREVVIKDTTSAFLGTISGGNEDILTLIIKAFEFARGDASFQTVLSSADKFVDIKQMLTSSIENLYKRNPAQRDEYINFVNELFTDSYDIGTIIAILMKCADEVSKFTEMSGAQKKEMIQQVFNGILDFSPLDESEKKLARLAFSGIVEAIIWAKHGGLKQAKDKCSKWCLCKK